MTFPSKQLEKAARQWVERTSPTEKPEMKQVLSRRLLEAPSGSLNFHILNLQCECNLQRRKK